MAAATRATSAAATPETPLSSEHSRGAAGGDGGGLESMPEPMARPERRSRKTRYADSACSTRDERLTLRGGRGSRSKSHLQVDQRLPHCGHKTLSVRDEASGADCLEHSHRGLAGLQVGRRTAVESDVEKNARGVHVPARRARTRQPRSPAQRGCPRQRRRTCRRQWRRKGAGRQRGRERRAGVEVEAAGAGHTRQRRHWRCAQGASGGAQGVHDGAPASPGSRGHAECQAAAAMRSHPFRYRRTRPAGDQ